MSNTSPDYATVGFFDPTSPDGFKEFSQDRPARLQMAPHTGEIFIDPSCLTNISNNTVCLKMAERGVPFFLPKNVTADSTLDPSKMKGRVHIGTFPVFINQNFEVLVIEKYRRRPEDIESGRRGPYYFAGGLMEKVDLNSLLTAGLREAEEEAGSHVTEELDHLTVGRDPEPVALYNSIAGTRHNIMAFYVIGYLKPGIPTNIEKSRSEIRGAGWISILDLWAAKIKDPQMTYPSLGIPLEWWANDCVSHLLEREEVKTFLSSQPDSDHQLMFKLALSVSYKKAKWGTPAHRIVGNAMTVMEETLSKSDPASKLRDPSSFF